MFTVFHNPMQYHKKLEFYEEITILFKALSYRGCKIYVNPQLYTNKENLPLVKYKKCIFFDIKTLGPDIENKYLFNNLQFYIEDYFLMTYYTFNIPSIDRLSYCTHEQILSKNLVIETDPIFDNIINYIYTGKYQDNISREKLNMYKSKVKDVLYIDCFGSLVSIHIFLCKKYFPSDIYLQIFKNILRICCWDNYF